MTQTNLEGIIYKVMDYQESSKLLFVYTPVGKKTLVAKGALNIKSSYRILSQYLTIISFEDQNKQMLTLKNAKLINELSNIKTNYDLVSLTSKLLIIIDKLITSDLPHDKIYNQVIEVLNLNNLEEGIYSLVLKLLKPLGFEPTFWQDGVKILGFNIEHGSIATNINNYNVDFNLEELTIVINFYYLNYEKLPLITDNERKVLIRFITMYYQMHMMHNFM